MHLNRREQGSAGLQKHSWGACSHRASDQELEILVRLLCKDRSHDLFVIHLLGERSRTPQLHTVMHRVIQQLDILNAGKSEIK